MAAARKAVTSKKEKKKTAIPTKKKRTSQASSQGAQAIPVFTTAPNNNLATGTALVSTSYQTGGQGGNIVQFPSSLGQDMQLVSPVITASEPMVTSSSTQYVSSQQNQALPTASSGLPGANSNASVFPLAVPAFAQSGGQGTHATPLISVCDDIGTNVSDKVKEKIWSGVYVDLATLLCKDDLKADTGTGQKIVVIDGELVIKQKTPETKIATIEQWTDAFLIYVSIYIQKHHTQVNGLLRYMHNIRLGASRQQGTGWLIYDQQFRLKKARSPETYWGVIDGELWLLCYYVQPQPLF